MDDARVKIYQEFDAIYRVKAQMVKVLMESEKYKDAYSSVIDDGLKIRPDTLVVGTIDIIKEPRKRREPRLRIMIAMTFLEIVTVSIVKYDSKNRLSKEDIDHRFVGALEKFQDLDLNELVMNILEEFIPIV